MTRRNYSLNHSRNLGWRAPPKKVKARWRGVTISQMPPAEQAARQERVERRHGGTGVPFKAKYPGWCRTCKAEFGAGTRIVYNAHRQVVHYGGCPSKR